MLEKGWIIPMGMHWGHLSVIQPKISLATVYLEPFSFFFCICLQGIRQGMVPALCVLGRLGSPAKEKNS